MTPTTLSPRSPFMADSIHIPTAARLPMATMLRLRGVHFDDDGGVDGSAAVLDEERGTANDDDESTKFVNRMAAKYEKEDGRAADEEDGMDDAPADDDDDDEEADDKPAPKAKKGKAVAATNDDDDAEHPDAETADEDDEPSDDAADDSAEHDDEEHPDDADEADPDSDDDADATDEPADDEEEDDVSPDTKAALTARGADLTLEDVPAEYRPIVAKKVREIDRAFTKVMQESTAFRGERTKLLADEKFRTENPEIVVVELLRKHPDLFDKVNEQLVKLDGDATVAEAFEIVVSRKRDAAVKAIEEATQGEQKFEARVAEVEALTVKHAAETGLPDWIADQAVGNAVSAAIREKREITNAEVREAVRAAAKQYNAGRREKERKKSKQTVQDRTKHRKAAPPGLKKPAQAATPGAASSKSKAKVDWNSQESRQNRILDSTRKLAPGTR